MHPSFTLCCSYVVTLLSCLRSVTFFRLCFRSPSLLSAPLLSFLPILLLFFFLNLFILSSPYCSLSLFYLPLFSSICCIIFSRLCPLHPVSFQLSHSFSSKSFLSIIFLLYVLFCHFLLGLLTLDICSLSSLSRAISIFSAFSPPIEITSAVYFALLYFCHGQTATQEKCVYTHTQSMHGIPFTFNMHMYFTQAMRVHTNTH